MEGPSKEETADRSTVSTSELLAHSLTESSSTTSTEVRADSAYADKTRPNSPNDPSSSQNHYSFEDGKPSSKTSLGKVYFKLKSLPSLLLVDVDVYTMETVTENGEVTQLRTMVESKRLRRRALLEWLKGLDQKGSEQAASAESEKVVDWSQIAFDLEARSRMLDDSVGRDINDMAPDDQRFGRTNRLVIPVQNEDTAIKASSILQANEHKELRDTKKELSKAKKQENPDNVDGKPIFCVIVRAGRFVQAPDETERQSEDGSEGKSESESEMKSQDGSKKTSESESEMKSDDGGEKKMNLYTGYVQLLFQHQCSSNYNAHGSAYGPIAEIIDHPDNRKADDAKLMNLVDTLKEKDKIHQHAPSRYDLRFKPLIDVALRLCIKCDLVPVIEGGSTVAHYASYHFPANPGTIPSMTQSLRKSLSGVRVRCVSANELHDTHITNAVKDDGTTEDRSSGVQDSQEFPKREYIIRNIKTNSDVGKVIPKTSETGETRFSNVKSYLRDRGTHLDAKFDHLPLADIGNKKPFWVPLDLLIFSGDQVPPNMGHLTEELQRLRQFLDPVQVASRAAKLIHQKSGNATGFFDWDENFNMCDISLPFFASPEFPYTPLKATPRHAADPKLREKDSEKVSTTLTVLCITPKFDEQAGKDFAADVKEALINEQDRDPAYKVLEISNWKVRLVKSGPELARLQDAISPIEKKTPDKKVLEEDIDLRAKVLIAVIDDTNMSTKTYHETVAEVRRFGDRAMGAVTVCISKQDIDSQRRRRGGRLTLPLTLLQKIRFMLGKKNWKTPDLSQYVEGNFQDGLILIGAHSTLR